VDVMISPAETETSPAETSPAETSPAETSPVSGSPPIPTITENLNHGRINSTSTDHTTRTTITSHHTSNDCSNSNSPSSYSSNTGTSCNIRNDYKAKKTKSQVVPSTSKSTLREGASNGKKRNAGSSSHDEDADRPHKKIRRQQMANKTMTSVRIIVV
jgi:hypothetical protein